MRRLGVGVLVVLSLVGCAPAGPDTARPDAVAGNWLKAHNAGQAEWAAGFYAPNALIRDSDGVTLRGPGAPSAWERLTSGLYRYEVEDATWTDAETLQWEISASPVQFSAPPRHFELTVRPAGITGFDSFTPRRQPSPRPALPTAPSGVSWPVSLMGAAVAAVGVLATLAFRRRPRARRRPRLKVLEPLRAFAEARRAG